MKKERRGELKMDIREAFAKAAANKAKTEEEEQAKHEREVMHLPEMAGSKRGRVAAEGEQPPRAGSDADSDGSDSDDDGNEGDALKKTTKAKGDSAATMAKLLQQGPPFDANTLSAKWPPAAATALPQPAPFAFFCDVLSDVSSTGSRLACTKLLAHMYQALLIRSPTDLLAAVYLTVSKLAPAHEGVELGIGDAVLVKVVSEVCGMTEKRVKEEYQKAGDLAEIAQNNKKKQATLMKPKDLSIAHVFKVLKQIASMSGKEVMRRRIDLIKGLLRDAKGAETNFLIRALQGKMRIGVAEPTALTALSFAFVLQHLGPQKVRAMNPEELQSMLSEAAETLTRYFHEVPSLDIVLSAVVKHGYLLLVPDSEVAKSNKSELGIRPGLPVKPQLAHPTNGITTVLDRFQGRAFTCEYKYDGERAQIHYCEGQGFSIYSRNSETHTTKFPDIIKMMPTVFDQEKVKSFILDSEVVAIDSETGALQAFQVLQHRGRKNISLEEVTIPVCVFAFDLLYLNGASVMDKTLKERRLLLADNFSLFIAGENDGGQAVVGETQPIESGETQLEEGRQAAQQNKAVVNKHFRFAVRLDTEDTEEIQEFLNKSIADGCEGLMIKALLEDSQYTPSKRSHFWLKLKKDYMEGVTDTVDLVPIGAYYGKGKRTGVFGGFLLAVYDAESEEYQSICKIGTGFTDEMLETVTAQLTPFVHSSPMPYYRYHETHKCDVWFSEAFVWEVKAADLSISPVHYAGIGLVSESKGIALRFPRFLRNREDKGPMDATSSAQIADMYQQQALAASGAAAAAGGGDE